MIRSLIYDTLILKLTTRWHAKVPERLPEGTALLDVGIGATPATCPQRTDTSYPDRTLPIQIT